MWQCRHAPKCTEMPKHVRKQLATLKRGSAGLASPAQRDEIWSKSARELGLEDTRQGIFRSASASIDDGSENAVGNVNANSISNAVTLFTPTPISPWVVSPDGTVAVSSGSNATIGYEQLIQGSELVSVQDAAPTHIAVAFAQFKRCYLTTKDQTGSYKSRGIGFVGLCCKWCDDEPGTNGRYFPNKAKSLSKTTTVKSILNHVSSCPKCPNFISHAVMSLQSGEQSLNTSDVATNGGSLMSSNGHGRKAQFIENVWNRLHGSSPDANSNATIGNPSQSAVRSIQDAVAIKPKTEYESLDRRPLVDDNGRRVSVYVDGFAVHSLPLLSPRKRARM